MDRHRIFESLPLLANVRKRNAAVLAMLYPGFSDVQESAEARTTSSQAIEFFLQIELRESLL